MVVQAEPKLRIPGNGDSKELEKKMSEVRGVGGGKRGLECESESEGRGGGR